LAMRHDFYGDGKESRFSLHPDAKSEVLRRLLKLNHARYVAEVAAGLHEKGRGKPKGAKMPKSAQATDMLTSPRRNLFDTQLTLGEVE